MYKISDEVKQLILNIGNGVYVNYILTFPELDLTVNNDTLYQESIKIIQSLCEDEELTLGGCIASSMTFEVAEIIDKDINNCRFSAGIQLVDNTGKKLADTIPMGVFAVASAKSVDDKDYKDVTAYDDMYYKASVDVTKWYDNYFPIIGTTTNKDSEGNSITTNVYGKTTLRQFRNDLLEHLGISYKLQDLPNDDMVVEKTISISNGSISGQALLKMICTLHGGFGIMNREGLFVVVHVIGGALYPEEILYPEETLYPEEEFQYIGVNGTDELLYPEYRTVSYEEYMCNHITCVNLRTDSEDLGVTVGSDISNPYVISANYFLYGKSAAELEVIGNNILEKINGITYRPCTIDVQGLPYVDVGDTVALEKKTVDIESFVFSRTLSGIQNIRDEYSAKGTEIRENEVSANEEFEQLKSKTIKITKSVDGLSVELADLEKNTASKFEQTAESITAEVARANAAEGDLSGRISITADAVTQEVTRAKGEEATLSGRITVTADAITQEVSRAKGAEETLSGRITVTAGEITQEVSRATSEENTLRASISLKIDKDDDGQIISMINESADVITLNSNRLVVNSTNFTLDRNGVGSIGGWQFTNDCIYSKTNATFSSSGTNYILGGWPYKIAMWQGKLICGIQVGSEFTSGPPVTNSGYCDLSVAGFYSKDHKQSNGYLFAVDVLNSSVTTNTGAFTASDRRLKTNINEIDEQYANDLIDGLKPSTYRMIDGKRTHSGFIADEVKQTAEKVLGTAENFAAYATVKIDEDKQEYAALRYEEFIAPLTKYCQCLKRDLKQEIERNQQLQFQLLNLQGEFMILKQQILGGK